MLNLLSGAIRFIKAAVEACDFADANYSFVGH